MLWPTVIFHIVLCLVGTLLTVRHFNWLVLLYFTKCSNFCSWCWQIEMKTQSSFLYNTFTQDSSTTPSWNLIDLPAPSVEIQFSKFNHPSDSKQLLNYPLAPHYPYLWKQLLQIRQWKAEHCPPSWYPRLEEKGKQDVKGNGSAKCCGSTDNDRMWATDNN